MADVHPSHILIILIFVLLLAVTILFCILLIRCICRRLKRGSDAESGVWKIEIKSPEIVIGTGSGRSIMIWSSKEARNQLEPKCDKK